MRIGAVVDKNESVQFEVVEPIPARLEPFLAGRVPYEHRIDTFGPLCVTLYLYALQALQSIEKVASFRASQTFPSISCWS